jgi:outer membrane lipoprotein-sorting protein
MKTLKITLFALLVLSSSLVCQAQTVDEIIDNYLENTGGVDNWKNVKTLKFTGIVNAQGMEIPWEMYQTKDGKQALTIDLQGKKITQFAFDGESMWTTNFATMQAEKGDAETSSNMKKTAAKDFPSPFIDYKEKGYTVELVGEEIMEGTETFKIKLVQDPIMVDGEETQNITFFYFDKENFVPIASEREMKQGPMKGQMLKDIMSDYDEQDGLYFPYSMTSGGQPLTVKTIEVNPEIDDAVFAFPAPADAGKKE